MSNEECAEPIRIACIGSSVTKGTGLGDPAKESYPTQLASFLAANGYPAVDMRNFGEGGAGILKRGCNPFWDLDQFADALVFDPDVLIIHLGTNDSREEFWNSEAALLQAKENMFESESFAVEEANTAIVHGELEFEQDLDEFVEMFARMPANPDIFLCTPVPLFHSNGWLKKEILSMEIAPRIRNVAARRGLRVVELLDSSLAQNHALFPDGVHPSRAGATEIATIIGQVLVDDSRQVPDDLHAPAVKPGTVDDCEDVAAKARASAAGDDEQMTEEDR